MTDPLQLRPYQIEALDQLRDNMRRGVKSQVLAIPTGSGKTRIAMFLLRECAARGKRAIFVADRTVLVDQTSAVLDEFGIDHGVMMADHWRFKPWAKVQVATAQTISRRKWPGDLSLLVWDECHTRQTTVIDRIKRGDLYTIGLSATPTTKGMGGHFETVVSVTTTNRLIEDGHLVPYRIFAASEPDMEGAKLKRDGEWSEEDARQRVLPIVGDCVTEYLSKGEGRKFIAFCVDTAHSAEMQRQFMNAGIRTELYTYKETGETRDRAMEEYRKPDSDIRGLISVSALSRGLDVPDVGLVILARPLRRSLAELIQSIGRGLRPAPGKADCIVLDHAGNTVRMWEALQAAFEEGFTELDDGKPKAKPEKRERKEPEPLKCPRCAHVHKPMPMCPACGHEYPRRSKVEVIAGELREFTGAVGASADEAAQALYSQLLYIAQERGYQKGWAYHKYIERTGQKPTGLRDEPAAPSPKVRGWVRSRMIAYAKGRAKATARQ